MFNFCNPLPARRALPPLIVLVSLVSRHHGCRLTPTEREVIDEACGDALADMMSALKPSVVVGVGNFAGAKCVEVRRESVFVDQPRRAPWVGNCAEAQGLKVRRQAALVDRPLEQQRASRRIVAAFRTRESCTN